MIASAEIEYFRIFVNLFELFENVKFIPAITVIKVAKSTPIGSLKIIRIITAKHEKTVSDIKFLRSNLNVVPTPRAINPRVLLYIS